MLQYYLKEITWWFIVYIFTNKYKIEYFGPFFSFVLVDSYFNEWKYLYILFMVYVFNMYFMPTDVRHFFFLHKGYLTHRKFNKFKCWSKWTNATLDTTYAFCVSKDVIKLDLSCCYFSEDVWLVGISTKQTCLVLKEVWVWTSIFVMTCFNIVLDWYQKVMVGCVLTHYWLRVDIHICHDMVQYSFRLVPETHVRVFFDLKCD